MAELEGKTLDRYELRRLIGKGGMANVYEALDKQTERIVAVKIFKREEEEMLRRFIREAQLMASMRENHLVPIYDYGSSELDHSTFYYIVMPYMEGGTLRARIRRGPLPLVEVCRAIREVAGALDYTHKHGIIHRDIKASNVLISSDGNYFLTDFGIARIVSDATQLTSTGNVLGTVDYVAPELFELDRRADERSDLYSLGVLLYEMVTGRLPFSAENQIALVSMHMHMPPPSPRSIIPSIPPPVESVILKSLEKNPALRFGSAKELAGAFCQAVSTTTGASIPDYPTLLPPEFVSSAPAPHPDQLVLSPPDQLAPSIDVQGIRPSPLASGTEGMRFSPQQPQAHNAGGNLPAAPPPVQPHQPQRPGQPGLPQRKPFYRRPWFSIFIILLSLLIIAGSVAIIFMPRGQANTPSGTATQSAQAGQTQQATTGPTATPNLTATAQAAMAASATARAQATASAIAALTATAAAQASATAGVIQTATSGQPAYQDSLNNANNAATSAAGWDQSDNCAFQGDGYHVTTASGLQGCKEANNTYPNAAITAVMRIVSGQSGGVFFRMTTNVFGVYTGYLLEVDSTGRYRILSGTYTLSTPTVLKNWTPTNALNKGGASNTLQVIARGNSLSFFANGAFLVQLS